MVSAPFLVASLCWRWCALLPLAHAQTTGIMSGRVTNSQGQPQTVLVHLLAEGDIPAGDAYSDSNGSYVFMGLPSGTYVVVGGSEGYKPFRGTTRLEENIQPRGASDGGAGARGEAIRLEGADNPGQQEQPAKSTPSTRCRRSIPRPSRNLTKEIRSSRTGTARRLGALSKGSANRCRTFTPH